MGGDRRAPARWPTWSSAHLRRMRSARRGALPPLRGAPRRPPGRGAPPVPVGLPPDRRRGRLQRPGAPGDQRVQGAGPDRAGPPAGDGAGPRRRRCRGRRSGRARPRVAGAGAELPRRTARPGPRPRARADRPRGGRAAGRGAARDRGPAAAPAGAGTRLGRPVGGRTSRQPRRDLPSGSRSRRPERSWWSSTTSSPAARRSPRPLPRCRRVPVRATRRWSLPWSRRPRGGSPEVLRGATCGLSGSGPKTSRTTLPADCRDGG